MNHLFVAGFDFGTSCSKVVIRDQFTKDLAKPVTFGAVQNGLLPSFVSFDGAFIYGPLTISDAPRISYIKLLAADSASGERSYESLYQTADLSEIPSVELLLTRYFLSVIQGILTFLNTDLHWEGAEIGRDPLVVQLAVPTGLMGGDSALENLMSKALRTAYLMGIEERIKTDSSTIDELRDWLKKEEIQSPAEREDMAKRCMIYPEVAGGVQTVLRAKNYPEGKYITMDVGAGTVDMNVFYRRKRDHSREILTSSLDYWSSKVAPLGCARISGRAAARATHETVRHEFDEADLKIHLQFLIRSLMYGAFRYQPFRVQGDGPSPWCHDTHVFVFGGGSALPIYSESLVSSLHLNGLVAINVEQLPEPGPGFDLPHDVSHFGRFAVAFGLSYHMADLETIKLSSELATFKERYPDILTEEDRENDVGCTCYWNPICPRCAGSGIVKRDLAIQTDIFSSLIEASHRANRRSAPIMGPEATALNKLIDHYNKKCRQLDIIDCYVILKRVHTLHKLSAGKSNGRIREDARKLLEREARRLKGKVIPLKSSVQIARGGIIASVSLSCGPPIRIYFLVDRTDKLHKKLIKQNISLPPLFAILRFVDNRLNIVLHTNPKRKKIHKSCRRTN